MARTRNVYEYLDEVLYSLCQHDCNIMECWVPYSCTAISAQLGISVYAARKCMRKLVENGLAVRDSMILDSEESYLPVVGFCLADNGRTTEAYKRASKEEAKYCAEIFGGVTEDYIRAFA